MRHIPFARLVVWLCAAALVAGALAYQLTPPPTPADACGFTSTGDLRDAYAFATAPLQPGETELTVWSPNAREACLQAYLPVFAAMQLSGSRIRVRPTGFGMLARTVFAMFNTAAAAGRAPDIATAGPFEISERVLGQTIVPLDECIARHPEFEQVDARLWAAARRDGKIWGVPFQVTTHGLYYNKDKLRELGWSELRIASLPVDIRQGRFTIDDMLDTAEEAVRRGVIQPGYAVWPPPERNRLLLLLYLGNGGQVFDSASGRLVLDREPLADAYRDWARIFQGRRLLGHPNFAQAPRASWNNRVVIRDTFAEGRVLFWADASGEWGNISFDKFDSKGKASGMAHRFGYALFPSGSRGRPGVGLWDSPGFYTISAPVATGRAHQEAACAVLARATRLDINVLQARLSGHDNVIDWGALAAIEPAYAADAERSQVFRHSVELPVELSDFWRYTTILEESLASMPSASSSVPGSAQLSRDDNAAVSAIATNVGRLADETITRMKVELGDALMVR
jgi:ABC-type glycerol-3-phosphate transport system substrate-binding protein